MTQSKDEITEIPFEVFWDKYMDINPGIYNKALAQKEWDSMHENDRVNSFSALCRIHPMLQICREPYQFLQHFNLPF